MTNLEIVKKILDEKQASLVVMFKEGNIEEYYNKRVEDIVTILKKQGTITSQAMPRLHNRYLFFRLPFLCKVQ